MTPILHIFRKDVRHHWPEILVSFLLLLVYAWSEPRQWTAGLLNLGDMPGQFLIEIVRFLLPVSWIFLTLRIVHDEPLVGDRQFWVTRPYDWRQLLASKLLFAVICINLPSFFVQMLLLKLAGFPVVPYIFGLLKMQFSLFMLLVLATLFGVVTRTLTQAILLILACIIALSIVSPLLSLVPNFDVNYVNRVGDIFSKWLSFLTVIAAILWQYAKRGTRQSIALLLGVITIVLIINIATPYATLMAKAYPLGDPAHPLPAQFAFKSPSRPKSDQTSSNAGSDVTLLIPLQVRGIAKNSAIRTEAARLSIDGPGGVHWDSNWKAQWQTLWPGDDSTTSAFALKRIIFDKLKAAPVTLRLSLAMTSYSESGSHQVIVQDGFFPIPEIGICKLVNPANPVIGCRIPVYYPSYMASFSAAQSTCKPENASTSSSSQLTGNTLDFTDRGMTGLISPVIISYVDFQVAAPPPLSSRSENRLRICPGTPIQFGTPLQAGNSRVELQTSQVNLGDYVVLPESFSGEVRSWDIRAGH